MSSKHKSPVKPPGTAGEPPVTISIKITVPRKVIWVASGFLSGGITVETLVRVISGLHGG
jgi:hypothetical protein